MTSKVTIGKPLLALMIAAFLVAGIVIGYYYAFLTIPKPTGYQTVRIGYLIADVHQSPFFIAYEEEWYQEEGIDPIKVEYMNGALEMEGFLAGEIDAGYVGSAPAMIAASKGAEIVILASSNKEGSAIVAKPGINSVEELNGTKVGTPGIGTIQDVLLTMVEEEFNITVTHVDYTGAVPTLPIDLESGVIDAFIAWEVFCADAVVRGIGNVVYTSHDILPDHQCCVLWVSKKLYDERPYIVKDLVRVHAKALKFIQENSTGAQEIVASATGRTLAVVQNAWPRMTWGYHVNTETMITLCNVMIATTPPKISPEDVPDVNAFVMGLVNETVLEKVLTEMGIP